MSVYFGYKMYLDDIIKLIRKSGNEIINEYRDEYISFYLDNYKKNSYFKNSIDDIERIKEYKIKQDLSYDIYQYYLKNYYFSKNNTDLTLNLTDKGLYIVGYEFKENEYNSIYTNNEIKISNQIDILNKYKERFMNEVNRLNFDFDNLYLVEGMECDSKKYNNNEPSFIINDYNL